MQTWQPGKRARSTLAVVLAASWVGACDADDTGLFSNDAPLSPTGGSGGSSMVASAGSAGAGGTRLPVVSAGSGGADAELPDDQGGAGGEPLPTDEPPGELPPALPGDPSEVAFQNDDCEPFEPCGGTLTGDWVFSDACIEDADLGLDVSDDGCGDFVARVDATVSGGLRFGPGIVQREGTGSGTGNLRIADVCTLTIASCPGLRALIDDDDACEQNGTDCLCEFATAELEWEQDTYQASGNSFTLGSGRTFDYCVEGNTLTYRETTEGASPQDAALHVLTR